jgi:hypothetical protein
VRYALGLFLALLGWLSLVVFLTWPLAANTSTHLASVGSDTLYSIWALAWETHAMGTDPLRMFDANIYHPALNSLAYGPSGFGALVLFGPAFAATSDPIFATNVLFLGGSTLTAWATGLVVTRWTGSVAAGAVAGAAYLSSPWVLYEWVPHVPHYAMLMWLPLIAYMASSPSRRIRDALLLALMVALQSAVELVYIAPVVFAALGLISAARLCRRSTRIDGLYLAASLVIAVLALSPLIAAHVSVAAANPGISQQSEWAGAPWTTFTMIPWNLFGWWQTINLPFGASPPMALAPAAVLLIAAGAVLLRVRTRTASDPSRTRAWQHAALWTAAGAYLALTPNIDVFGTTIALPRRWLGDTFPAIQAIRVPMRLAVAGLMGLSLLTGLAFAEIAGSLSRKLRRERDVAVLWGLLGATALVLILGQRHAMVGYPPGFKVSPVPRPYLIYARPKGTPFIDELRASRGPMLELGAATFRKFYAGRPMWEAGTMFRSIDHWRPLLNGYSSYWPVDYERFMELAARLPEDLNALAELRSDSGLELILVRSLELPAETRDTWQALAATDPRSPLALVASAPGGMFLFRITDD